MKMAAALAVPGLQLTRNNPADIPQRDGNGGRPCNIVLTR
jgi:hypothetical protein